MSSPTAPPDAPLAAAPGLAAPRAEALLAVVGGLVAELYPQQAAARRPALDSALERELGLDSLARAELLLRLESSFGIALPERVLAEAETPRDLLTALARGATVRAAGGAPSPAAADQGEDALAAAEAAPESAPTLLAVLAWHVRRHAQRRHLVFLDGEVGVEELTYGELQRRAERVAAALLAQRVEPGEAVALMLPSGCDYFATFLGIQLAGGVPVPLYPPARRSQVEDHLRRQARILANARAGLLVAAPEVRSLARLLTPLAPALRGVVTPGELLAAGDHARLPPVAADDVAFIQYTSGSTGDPKGVVLTHENLLANLRAAGRALSIGGDDVVVSWLPLYHDMGLIGAWMGSLYFGVPLVLMSPLAFLSKPVRWLQAVHRYRGTITAAPNFAFGLCTRKVSDAEIAGLDLASWRIAMNGAEPVSPETIEQFCARFAAVGFRREAMTPVYGLAEATLAVAFTPAGRGPRVAAIDRRAFQATGEARPAPAGEDAAAAALSEADRPLRFVSCGYPVPGHEVRVVDEAGRELPERRQGRLQVRGPSVTRGYFRRPDATAAVLHDGWLDTGDLGFVAEGEVYVSGRRKDLIIRAGRNVHPQELEEAVGALPGARKGCVAVFATGGGEEGTERLVVMAETREQGEAREELRRRIGEVALELTGTPADEVVLVPTGTVPKTSSGKIRRSAARELHERGVTGGGRALWWQLVRLGLTGLPARVARGAAALGERLWGLWCLLAVLGVGGACWLGVLLLPTRRARWALSRGGARLLTFATGTSLRVSGLEELPDGPCVLVSNHQSYLDGFVLSAALPPRFAFVVKGELLRSGVTRWPLRALGALFVERYVADRGGEEARRGAAALADGQSLVIFPEGTFRRAPGLLPFRMGAFVAAALAGAPVVPAVVRGSRSLLRAGEWLPRRSRLQVAVGPALLPGGAGWTEAVALRDGARAWMLAHLGEPDLGGEELLLPPAT